MIRNSFKIILRGVGQVMLQNNALTGLLFLIGIFYNSWLMAIGAILGNIISTISAVFLGYSKEDIKKGLYGFNGTLVGIAIWFLFNASIITVFAIVIGAIFSTIIMHAMKKNVPAFTAPFVISTWLVIILTKFFNLTLLITSPLLENGSFNLFSSASMGFGQVMFQGNVITGIIFLFGILVNSRIYAIHALYGSILGGLFAMLFLSPSMANMGLFGYNGVLCAIALGDKKWKAVLLATVAIILSVLLNFSLNKLGIISLTAPFVLATWLVLVMKYYIKKEPVYLVK